MCLGDQLSHVQINYVCFVNQNKKKQKYRTISTLRALKKFTIVASGIHIKIKLTHGSYAGYIFVRGEKKKKSSQNEMRRVDL